MAADWEHHDVLTNGIRLHVAQAGPLHGPLVILLHGFPEFWYGWRHQMDALAQAGYRVWVPDQRGYNLSDRPSGLDAYRLDVLAADIAGLIDAAGREKACIVGHDWGGGAAWQMALTLPHRLERLAILNMPHPAAFQTYLRQHPSQWLKSSYVLFFQIPWLPEWMASLGNWWMPAHSMTASSRPGTFTPEELDRYREAWAQPGAYTGMLNWYRAAVRRPVLPPPDPHIEIPTLLIWGAKDPFLERGLAQPSIDLCANGELVFFETATHWLHHEEAERVNFLLDTFLSKSR